MTDDVGQNVVDIVPLGKGGKLEGSSHLGVSD